MSVNSAYTPRVYVGREKCDWNIEKLWIFCWYMHGDLRWIQYYDMDTIYKKIGRERCE